MKNTIIILLAMITISEKEFKQLQNWACDYYVETGESDDSENFKYCNKLWK